MNKSPLVNLIRKGYELLAFCASCLQPLLLLGIRLYWGYQFFITGLGKLQHVPKVVEFFTSLGIPFPTLNVYLAGSTECFGGLLLLLGVASRLITIPLMFTMIVAYVTASPKAFFGIFTDPDKFTSADPFLFLYAALIIFVFGPGPISVDGLLKRIFGGKNHEKTGTH